MGINVTIDDDLARFVEKKVESGEYGSAQAVVEDALRRLELDQQSDEERIAWLRAAHEEGIASGDAGEIDIEDVIKEARRQYEAGE
jgi:antitoxin ParD1/3/4